MKGLHFMLFAGFLINLCYFNVKEGFLQKHQERFSRRKAGNPDGWNEWKLTSPGTIGNIE